MNRIIVRFASLAVLLAAALFLGGNEEIRPVGISQIVRFLLRSSSPEGNRSFSFSLKEGVYRGIRQENGTREKIILPEKTVRELEEVLRRADAGKWNGFSGKDRKNDVSFKLEIEFDSGDLLEAEGKGVFPDHYPETEEEIFRIIQK